MSFVDDLEPPPSRHPRAVLPTLVSVAALTAIVSSLGAPLIPSIAHADHVSLSEGEWLLTATLMTGACATPVLGRLADGPRPRRILALTLAVVLAGCVLAAVSTTFLVLVIGRGLQGFGLGLLPVTMAMARNQLPPDQAKRAIATLSVIAAVGLGLGYPITALIAQAFDVAAAFWFGAIAVAVGLVLVLAVLPARSAAPARRLDVIGATTLGIAIIAISLTLSEGGGWGWTSPGTVLLLVGSAVFFALWIWRELTTPEPLIDVRQVRHRQVATADGAAFLMGISMYLFLPIVVEFVQIPRTAGYGFGASLVGAGFVLVPLSAGSYLSSRCLVRFERRFGARALIPFGSLAFTATALFFAFEHRAFWEAFVASGVGGIGLGFTFAAMPGLIVRAVPPAETGSALGFYQVWRSVGLSVGSALAAAILTANTARGGAIPHLHGFRDTLLVAAALSVAAGAVGYLLPGRLPTLSAAETEAVQRIEEEEAELAATAFSFDPVAVPSDAAGSQR